MTRHKLKTINNRRERFRCMVDHFGTKSAYRGLPLRTIMLVDVTRVSTGEKVTDHLWFNLTKGFDEAALSPGDTVEFDARVKEYWKGYTGYREDVWGKPPEWDYKLSHPTRIVKITPTDKGHRISEAARQSLKSGQKSNLRTIVV